jgi:hypothetical protein
MISQLWLQNKKAPTVEVKDLQKPTMREVIA